jgi:FixJ family two-component response regulator
MTGKIGQTRTLAVRQAVAAGRRRKQIARDLGICSQSLTWHYGKLRQALVDAV